MKELTLEITNYCPHKCDYCSSSSINQFEEAKFLPYSDILDRLKKDDIDYDVIHLSGGEPLAHPDFYWILSLCNQWATTVIVHTNMITNLAYNPNVINGVYLTAYLNVPPETKSVHILRRVEQGKEANKPVIHKSRNWSEDCHCNNNLVIKPDGSEARSPCSKEEENGPT